jgi:hypothetical protein
MGCSLSTGQLSLTFSENLQCASQDNKTIVFNSSTGGINQIDSNIAKLLGFSFNLDATKNPIPQYINYIGIAPQTRVKLIFKGKAGATDPIITAEVSLLLDSTGTNINISGKINKMDGDVQLVQLSERTMLANTHKSVTENYPNCVKPFTDIVPQLPSTFVITGLQSSTYTYTLTQINFSPVSEQFIERFSAQNETGDNNMITFLVVALIILALLYFYTCYKSEKITV